MYLPAGTYTTAKSPYVQIPYKRIFDGSDMYVISRHVSHFSSTLLARDVRAISDYHTYPGETAQIRTYESKEEFIKDFTAVLAETEEDDSTVEKMFRIRNLGAKLASFFKKSDY